MTSPKVFIAFLATAVLSTVGCAGLDTPKAPSEKEMSAYLMVYFKDPTHSLYMALSQDGYTFTDVNGGQPVLDGRAIAEQQGIRDPHIARGPDGAFYLAMTDLHIFAQREGLRSTEWERDGSEYGWGNNRGLVLMKSRDLIHWTRSNVRVDQAFPGFEDIGCAWAPETIYDPDQGKMMIYFTMRFGNGLNKVYYAYTDDDFTRLETRPAWMPTSPGLANVTICSTCPTMERRASNRPSRTPSIQVMSMTRNGWTRNRGPAKRPMSGNGSAKTSGC